MKLKLMGLLLSTICATNLAYADTPLSKPVEHWVDFRSTDPRFQVPEEAAGVVFYRRAEDLTGPSVNIYVDGEYLASLLPNGFRYSLVCPKNQRFEAQFTGATYDNGYIRKEEAGEYTDLPPASISYFKVISSASGSPQAVRVPAEEARKDLQALREQTHTLPRVSGPQNCAARPAVLQRFTLNANALFAFDRSDYANMLPEGKREIQNIAAQIRQHGSNVGSIDVIGHVIGHTDPQGSDVYNQQLSEARAQTVKHALAESGLNANMIKASGIGEQNLVVANCQQQHPNNAAARKQCDQPNRRVEIIIQVIANQPHSN